MKQPTNRLHWTLILLMIVSMAAIPLQWGTAQSAGTSSLSGWLNILWGDSSTGGDRLLYQLTLADGQVIELDWNSPNTPALPLNRQFVQLKGHWTSQGELFVVSELATAGGNGAVPQAEKVVGAQPWVSVLCKFADIADEPKPAPFFQDMYSSDYPGLDHYWREQSFDKINVSGSAAATQWYTLPQPRASYVYDRNNDSKLEFDASLAAQDCTSAADAAINYPSFVGINLMFNSDLDGNAWGGSNYMSLDGVSRVWYMTWEPPWGYNALTVIEHEMGHGFGMPHSSGMYGQTYDNRWDVMSDTWTDCARLTHPTYGCLGQHTIAYHKDISGWIGTRKVFASPGTTTTITLERLAQPNGANPLMVQIPIQNGLTRFYTVEVRQRVGNDVKLPGQAVIIHLVDITRERPAQVVDIDRNGDTGDAGAMWTVGETFQDAANGISVQVVSSTASGFVISISNIPPVPTPTPTPTSAETSRPTRTPTHTPTPKPSATPTLPSAMNWTYLPVIQR